MRITAVDALDVRFPTSRGLHGPDATHPNPDYPATYVVVRTDRGDGPEGMVRAADLHRAGRRR
jgi:L-fuconate dehydratase